MKRLLIGANNKTKKLEKEKAYKVIGNYANGFTGYVTDSFWQGKREKGLAIELDNIKTNRVNKLAKELATVLQQDKIAVQNIKTNIRFIA